MSSFQIQQFTRVRDDPCDQEVQNKEAMAPGAYQMTNLIPATHDAYEIAYQQPAMPAAPGYGWSAAAINAGNFADALATLEDLRQQPGLSPEQAAAVNEVRVAVKSAIATKPAH